MIYNLDVVRFRENSPMHEELTSLHMISPIYRITSILVVVCVLVIVAILPEASAQSTAMTFADSLVLPFIRVDTSSIEKNYPILYPYENGPINVLVIGDRSVAGRIADGFARRIDGTIETVLTQSRTQLGEPESSAVQISGLLGQTYAEQRLRGLLSKQWDAIWLSFNPSLLPVDISGQIRELVQAGATIITDGDPDEFDSYFENRGSLSRFSLPLMYRTLDSITGRSIGDGRVIFLQELPSLGDAQVCDDYLNMVSTATVSASTARSSIALLAIEAGKHPIEHEIIGIQRFRVRYRNQTDNDLLDFIIRCRDKQGRIVSETSHTSSIDQGEGECAIPYPVVPVGEYSLDVSCLLNGVVSSFAGASFSVETEDRIEEVRLWSSHAPYGDYVIGTLRVRNPFRDGMFVIAELHNLDGETLAQNHPRVVNGRKTVDFILTLRETFPQEVIVVVSFYKNNECVERSEHSFAITDTSHPQIFNFGISERSLYPGALKPEMIALKRQGATTFMQAIDENSMAGDFHRLLYDARAAGFTIVPDISSLLEQVPATENSDRYTALFDTLEVFNTNTVVISDFSQAEQVRSITSDIQVLQVTKPEHGAIFQDNSNMENSEARSIVIPAEWLSQDDLQRLLAIPWWSLLSGSSHMWWPNQGGGVVEKAVTPAGRPAPAFSYMGKAVQKVEQMFETCWNFMLPFEKEPYVSEHIQGLDRDILNNLGSWVYRDSLMTCLTIVPDPSKQTEIPERLFVTCPDDDQEYYPYDLISSTYLGIDDSLQVAFQYGAVMVAWVPYRVLRVDMVMKQTIYTPEDTLRIQAEIIPSHDSPLVRHPFELTVVSESGTESDDKIVFKNIIHSNNGEIEEEVKLFGFGYGQYRVIIRDLLSGNDVSRRFIIREQSKAAKPQSGL